MSQEQDQEKILNATAQVLNNSLSGGLYLASLKKSKVKIEVKTAKDDLSNARSALNRGVNLEAVKQEIFKSPVAKRIERIGGDVSSYVASIAKKAQIDNKMEKRATETVELQKTRKKTL
ncbi:hypothetical protein [Myxosarcina sp. GI1]|uniref:hypothetical protein n=1 Tax=Myxosarcina sp. GI1 TaxID=1541065 RepID=UPI00055A1389|nr:hypothetical protein [Myxosarcina sp. GI1]